MAFDYIKLIRPANKWLKPHSIQAHHYLPPKMGQPLSNRLEFESIKDMMEYVIKGYNKFGWPKDLAERGRKRPDGTHPEQEPRREEAWSWGESIESVIQLYKKGWAEGYDAVKWSLDKMAEAAITKLMEVDDLEKHVYGSMVDIPSFVNGEPECMFEFQTTERELLHLEVDFDWWIVCSTSAEEIFWRGIAVMSAVMALRRFGVFVDLYLTMPGRTSLSEVHDRTGEDKLRIKCHVMNQHITENFSETLLALCHPAFYRRVGFLAWMFGFGCHDSGVSYADQARSQDFLPVPGSGKITIPGNYREEWLAEHDDSGIDWSNAWSSDVACLAMIQMMLKCAAPKR